MSSSEQKNDETKDKTAGTTEDQSGHAPPHEVYHAVDSVSSKLNTIEQFIARRFDEISMEINATSQQVDMAEEGITKRFAEVFEILKAVSMSEDGNTPANAGVELDAVVEMTEKAANKILDAADRIASKLQDGELDDNESRKEAINNINQDVEEIFMACSFQDITGQRIRQTLENLKMIEDRLSGALDKIGIDVSSEAVAPPIEVVKAQSQDDIDAMFSESKDE